MHGFGSLELRPTILGMSPELLNRAATSVAQRGILLLNHVLSGEAQATQRLVAHAGRTVAVQIQSGLPLVAELAPLVMRITPAGLFELAEDARPDTADLSLKVDGTDLKAVLRQALAGQRPRIDVSGDASLAGDVNWLFDNLRWEPFDDLSRWWGDAPAAELARAGQAASQAARRAADWVSAAVGRWLSDDAAGRKQV